MQRPRRPARRRPAGSRVGHAGDRRAPDQPGLPGDAGGSDPDRCVRGGRAGDARARAEAADLLRRRASAPRARGADRRPGDRTRRALRRRLRRHGRDERRRGGGARAPRDARHRRGPRRLPQHGGRPARGADRHPAARTHGGRAPGVRARPPRAGGDGGHDELLRGGTRGGVVPGRDPEQARLPRLPLQRSGEPVRAGRAESRESPARSPRSRC